MSNTIAKFGTPQQRWACVGPYYAMFPYSFAEKVIRQYTCKGDLILDPYSGRGTAIYAAACNERKAIGIEINPVGFVYSRAKLLPANQLDVEKRLIEIGKLAADFNAAAAKLPNFFHHCYTSKVRSFLLAARQYLDWRNNRVDWTLMAFLLINLHGKIQDSLSNQMRQAKSLSPQYAIAWWKDKGFRPPEVNPVEYIKEKMVWRYAKGRKIHSNARVFLGDSESRLSSLAPTLKSLEAKNVKLLLTSPPYWGVTNYHYDQWLRLWLLGEASLPKPKAGPNRGKFLDRAKYQEMLLNVFTAAAELMSKDSVVYVRTDSREFTLESTIDALTAAFPKKNLRRRRQRYQRAIQTELFGGHTPEDGETDLVLK